MELPETPAVSRSSHDTEDEVVAAASAPKEALRVSKRQRTSTIPQYDGAGDDESSSADSESTDTRENAAKSAALFFSSKVVVNPKSRAGFFVSDHAKVANVIDSEALTPQRKKKRRVEESLSDSEADPDPVAV